jgi:hypothetical protein
MQKVKESLTIYNDDVQTEMWLVKSKYYFYKVDKLRIKISMHEILFLAFFFIFKEL